MISDVHTASRLCVGLSVPERARDLCPSWPQDLNDGSCKLEALLTPESALRCFYRGSGSKTSLRSNLACLSHRCVPSLQIGWLPTTTSGGLPR